MLDGKGRTCPLLADARCLRSTCRGEAFSERLGDTSIAGLVVPVAHYRFCEIAWYRCAQPVEEVHEVVPLVVIGRCFRLAHAGASEGPVLYQGSKSRWRNDPDVRQHVDIQASASSCLCVGASGWYVGTWRRVFFLLPPNVWLVDSLQLCCPMVSVLSIQRGSRCKTPPEQTSASALVSVPRLF